MVSTENGFNSCCKPTTFYIARVFQTCFQLPKILEERTLRNTARNTYYQVLLTIAFCSATNQLLGLTLVWTWTDSQQLRNCCPATRSSDNWARLIKRTNKRQGRCLPSIDILSFLSSGTEHSPNGPKTPRTLWSAMMPLRGKYYITISLNLVYIRNWLGEFICVWT
jgi:hypothetical protein